MLLTNHRTSKAGASTGIIFPKLECWNPVTEVATVAAEVDKQRVLCQISIQILKDKFGIEDGAPMSYIARHRIAIQDAARKLIENGSYEEDGSILIREQDI